MHEFVISPYQLVRAVRFLAYVNAWPSRLDVNDNVLIGSQ